MGTPRRSRIAVRVASSEKEALKGIAWKKRTTMSDLIRSRIEDLLAEEQESMSGEADS